MRIKTKLVLSSGQRCIEARHWTALEGQLTAVEGYPTAVQGDPTVVGGQCVVTEKATARPLAHRRAPCVTVPSSSQASQPHPCHTACPPNPQSYPSDTQTPPTTPRTALHPHAPIGPRATPDPTGPGVNPLGALRPAAVVASTRDASTVDGNARPSLSPCPGPRPVCLNPPTPPSAPLPPLAISRLLVIGAGLGPKH